ncbi:hypothetical protein DJ73_06180 [Halorubrum sp. Ea1]|uniref:hypothetical protein n=1 Tax=Halorubrum sp. Ea1 TaxID=1480718 RepID=UPI000B97D6C1|nr:hypothetical protein [Halorubrum sp. Ea1]OYR53886.1 hypothetical protein DJ73_06180 [Halorubrum sp. Ea1]
MSSGTCFARDCPEQYRDVINIVEAEETTIVDAVLTGKLEQDDLDTFLEYVAVADREIEPSLIHLVEIVDTLLEKRDS